MSAAEIPALLTTFGPMGLVIWWVLKTQSSAGKSETKDPVMSKLEDISTRLTRVETILEERKK